MDSIGQDLRHVLRGLGRNPGFAAAAVGILAFGIGALTTVFGVANAILLRPLPVASPQTLVRISSHRHSGTPYLDYTDYRERAKSLAGIAAFQDVSLGLRMGAGSPEHVFGELASGNFFELLGVRPILGRGLDPASDASPGVAAETVLGHGFWKRRFNADPSVLGRVIHLNGQAFTIVGVAPAGFAGGTGFLAADLWIPLTMEPSIRPGADLLHDRRRGNLELFGRLSPGASIDQARAEMTTLAAALEREHPDTNARRGVSVYSATALSPEIAGAASIALGFATAAMGLVLLLACTNVANLLLARATSRQREMGVRIVLGAGRGRLIRLLITESLVLSAAGGGAALLIAWLIRPALLALLPEAPVPIDIDLSFDPRVFLCTLLATAAATLLAGLAPALAASRLQPIDALRAAAGGAGGVSRGTRLRAALVVAQVTLSALMLVGAGLFLRSAAAAARRDTGMSIDPVLTATINAEEAGLDEAGGRALMNALVDRLEALPGVEAASFASILPLTLSNSTWAILKEGQDLPTPGKAANLETTYVNTVSPGHFRTLGIPLREGRDFARADAPGAPLSGIVNETLARRWWPGESAVGRRVRTWGLEGPGPWIEIVGVARDAKYASVGEDPKAFLYVPLAQEYSSMVSLLVRARGEPGEIVSSVREQHRALNPDLPLFDVKPLRDAAAVSLLPSRLAAWLFGVMGAAALLLAGFGLHGVLSYVVSSRMSEMGVRLALGARPLDVVLMVVRQGMRWSALGLALGVGLSLVLSRALQGVLFGVAGPDAAILSLVTVVLGGSAFAACLGPALRAARNDPAAALRRE